MSRLVLHKLIVILHEALCRARAKTRAPPAQQLPRRREQRPLVRVVVHLGPGASDLRSGEKIRRVARGQIRQPFVLRDVPSRGVSG